MVAPYETLEDANQQLGASVLLFKGDPMWCEGCQIRNGKISVLLYSLPRLRDQIFVDIDDPDLDSRDLGRRLGYVNTFGPSGALFVSRIPARQYKQGLSKNNVRILGGSGRLTLNDLRVQPGFTDAIKGIYPSFKRARERLQEDPDILSIAFNRNFALQRDELGFFVVLYRNERVAWGDPDAFKLPSHFQYLKELCQENGVVVA